MKRFLVNVSCFLKRINKVYLIIAGFIAFLWFLIRVIPKPSRAAYPCQRVAFPLASGFIIWLSVNVVSTFGLKKLISAYKKKSTIINLSAIVLIAFFYFLWLGVFPLKSGSANTAAKEYFVPIDSPNSPVGVPRGIFPGRVAWAYDSTASRWNGTSGNWWQDQNTDQAVVDDMLSRSLEQLSGKDNDVAAWDTIFKFFNYAHNKGTVGYTQGEKIAIKINLNQCTGTGNNGNSSYPSPQVVLALLRQLVNNGGVPAEDITFYDINRSVPKSITDRCKNEFSTVHFVGSMVDHNQEKFVRDTVPAGLLGGKPAHFLKIEIQFFKEQNLLQSFYVFMDFTPDRRMMGRIRAVLESDKRITRYHKLRARMAGSRILVDVHIHVPHEMPVNEAHTISHEIERKILDGIPQVKEVSIHIEPD